MISVEKAQNNVLNFRERAHKERLQREEQRLKRQQQFVSLLRGMAVDYCGEVMSPAIAEASEQGCTSLTYEGYPSTISRWLEKRFKLVVGCEGCNGYETEVYWRLPLGVGDETTEHPWRDAWSKYGLNKIDGWSKWNRNPDVGHIVMALGQALTQVLTEAGFEVTNTMSIGIKEGCYHKQSIRGGVKVSWAIGHLAETC